MPDLTEPALQRAIRLTEKMLLDAGPVGVLAKDVIGAAERIGISKYKLRVAREVLKVTSEKAAEVKDGPWIWKLPPHHVPIYLPMPDTQSTVPPSGVEYRGPQESAQRLREQDQVQAATQRPRPETIEEWARRKGYPIELYAQRGVPIAQSMIERFERETAKPASIVRTVEYQSYCPECGQPSARLTREVEFRETSDGQVYGINDGDVRQVLCGDCKSRRTTAKRANIEKRITSLEYQCKVLASADPNDPNILSTELHIEKLRRELADYERTLTDA